MLRPTLILGSGIAALVLVASVAVPQTAPRQTITPGPTACGNFLKQEPILMYDVSGSTIAGPIHQHLTVYNNGFVTFSEIQLGTLDNRALTTQVSLSEVQALLQGLRDTGAYQLCDGHSIGNDIPQKSVTVFQGATDARAHSFNFYTGSAFTDFQILMLDFIDMHIPPF